MIGEGLFNFKNRHAEFQWKIFIYLLFPITILSYFYISRPYLRMSLIGYVWMMVFGFLLVIGFRKFVNLIYLSIISLIIVITLGLWYTNPLLKYTLNTFLFIELFAMGGIIGYGYAKEKDLI